MLYRYDARCTHLFGICKFTKTIHNIMQVKRESSIGNKNLIDLNKGHILLHERCDINATPA